MYLVTYNITKGGKQVGYKNYKGVYSDKIFEIFGNFAQLKSSQKLV